MFDLTGKKALVTGGSGGIGAKIAEIFASQGCEVVITGSNIDKLKKVTEIIGGDKCSYIQSNLNNDDDLTKLCAAIQEQNIDILVCNAGITRDNLLLRAKDEEWQDVLNINLTASFKLIKSSLRSMMKKKYGRIINISSVVASSGNPGQANYCASKAGLEGMSRSIALEVASRGITVNCIAPGFIKTDMTDKLTEQQTEEIEKNIPNKKLGTTNDIASASLFLASEESSYITGQVIHVNGGLYLA